jgi:hypothetical protein
MEDPRQQQSMPPGAKKGNRSRNKRNGRASNGQPQQSSPNLDSNPSSPSANRNVGNGMHSQNSLADGDTISNASLESSKSPGRRRRARGGRKSKSKIHIASQQQQEAGVSDAQADQQLRDAERELYGYDDLPDSRTGEQGKGQHLGEDGRSAFATEDYEQKQDEQRSDTGIRAFNARRADPKGRQPVWMKVQRNSQNENAAINPKDRPQQQSSEPQEPSQQERIPRISVKQAAPGQGDANEGAQGQQQEKEVSIKFDLNLELELALKAKVKGEIMVTFL